MAFQLAMFQTREKYLENESKINDASTSDPERARLQLRNTELMESAKWLTASLELLEKMETQAKKTSSAVNITPVQASAVGGVSDQLASSGSSSGCRAQWLQLKAWSLNTEGWPYHSGPSWLCP